MKEKFEVFLEQLTETNATLDYFVDFEKIRCNISGKVSLRLNQLNYLIGKQNLEEAVKEVYEENKFAFEVLDILIAVRKNKGAKVLDKKGKIVNIDSYFSTPELIFEYMQETGLCEIFQNKEITNLVDYVFGIEVGLDTNARKNRGGDNMSKAISKLFDEGEITYEKEVNHTKFEDLKVLGKDIKRFDFVVRAKNKVYLIEANYYNSGGSKLNEVARAYSSLASKINTNSKYEFVWITDGYGWLSATNKLKEAFECVPRVYNLTTLKEFIEEIKKQ